jgi:hypothetical protein
LKRINLDILSWVWQQFDRQTPFTTQKGASKKYVAIQPLAKTLQDRRKKKREVLHLFRCYTHTWQWGIATLKGT